MRQGVRVVGPEVAALDDRQAGVRGEVVEIDRIDGMSPPGKMYLWIQV